MNQGLPGPSSANKAAMSQQLVFDISDATARSKGQARRRNQPPLSEEARKAQRNHARRERARCKKMGDIGQQLRPPVQPSPYADQPQYGAPLSTKEGVARKVPQTHLHSHRPAFTVLPAHSNNFNLRALAQSTRYIAARSKTQETKHTVRRDVQQEEDVDVVLAQNGFESRITPEWEDLDAAGILFGFAKDQHAIFTAKDNGTIPANTDNKIEADGTMAYPQNCPVATCEYHRKGFPLKPERDEHVMTHFEGGIKCGSEKCRLAYLEVRLAYFEVHFANTEQLRNHLHIYHPWDTDHFKCGSCYRNISKSAYLTHLEDCIVHTVELEASGRARQLHDLESL